MIVYPEHLAAESLNRAQERGAAAACEGTFAVIGRASATAGWPQNGQTIRASLQLETTPACSDTSEMRSISSVGIVQLGTRSLPQLCAGNLVLRPTDRFETGDRRWTRGWVLLPTSGAPAYLSKTISFFF